MLSILSLGLFFYDFQYNNHNLSGQQNLIKIWNLKETWEKLKTSRINNLEHSAKFKNNSNKWPV